MAERLNRKSAAEFQWPPPDEVLDRQVVAAAGLADQLSSSPSPTQTFDERDLSRVLAKTGARVVEQARAQRLPSNVVLAALLLLTVLASVEGVYILRMKRAHAAAGASAPPVAAAAPLAAPAATPAPRTPARSVGATFSRDGIADAGPTTGTVLIRSDPAGVQVVMDGRSRGVTPLVLTRVAPGEHRLTLKHGTEEVRQIVRMNPGATLSVVAPFQGGAATSGWLTISAPIELDILEGGALLGTTRSKQIMVPVGTHTLELVNEKLAYRGTEQVKVEPGGRTTVAVQLPLGSLRVNAKPWAEVWIDGERAGETPMANLKLPIGDHQITFRHPQLGERTVTATITTRDAARVTADLQSQTAPGR